MAESERTESDIDFWRPLSWSSIIFGALLALAIATTLHVLGVGIMASVADPAEPFLENILTLGGVSGVWFIISAAIGLFVGGFVAANLSRTFSDERAAIYGLGVWALATLATLGVAVPSLMAATGAVVGATGQVAGGALQAAGSTVQGLSTLAPPNLMQQVEGTLTGGQRGQVNQQGAQQILNIVRQAITQGSLNQAQAQQLESAVATTFNVPPEEARQRVEAVRTQVNQALGDFQKTAREAAQTALTGIATTAYWAFAAILIGAIAVLIGARYGALDERELPRFARLRMTRTMERGT